MRTIPRYSVTVHLTPSVEVFSDLVFSANDNDEMTSIVHDGSFYAHPTDLNPETLYIDVSADSESEAERLAVDYLASLFSILRAEA